MNSSSLKIENILSSIPNVTSWFDSSKIQGLTNKNNGINNSDLIGGTKSWLSLVGNSRLIKFPTSNCIEGTFVNSGLNNKPSVRLNNTGGTNVPTLMLDSGNDLLYSNANGGSTTILFCTGNVNYGNGFIWNGDLSGYYTGEYYSIGNQASVALGYGFRYGRVTNFINANQFQRYPKCFIYTSNINTTTDTMYSLENHESNSKFDNNGAATYYTSNPASITQNSVGLNRNPFIIGPFNVTEQNNIFTAYNYQGTSDISLYEFGIIDRVITLEEVNKLRTYFKYKYNL